jgi:hypothetical protein
VAGAGAGVAMAGWLMFCGEVADEPTGAPGVDSSTWTALTAIAAFLFGQDAFHGDFAALPVLAGLAIHLTTAAVLAVPGAALIVYALGERVRPLGAAAAGLAYGLTLQVVALNLVVNWLQSGAELHESIPRWGWWVGHAAYGVALGLLLARRLGPQRA